LPRRRNGLNRDPHLSPLPYKGRGGPRTMTTQKLGRGSTSRTILTTDFTDDHGWNIARHRSDLNHNPHLGLLPSKGDADRVRIAKR
jgi:hypothetical protein